jgi:DNA repair photolyase
MHKCKYCYASADFDICQHNYEMHNPKSPLLIGQLFPDDIVKEMAAKPINTLQSKQLF